MTMRLLMILSLAGSALSLGPARASESEVSRPEEAPATVVGLDFSFKLDPRLTRAQYLGDRWVAPPTYSINQAGTTASVDARAHAIDVSGNQVAIEPRWRSDDPTMVSVEPSEGSVVRITVHHAGESRLRVAADGVWRELTVEAVQKNGALLVEVTQVPPAGTPEGERRARILGGQAEKTGYAVGMNFGRRLKQLQTEIDADALAEGLRDALDGRTLFTEAELQAAVVPFQRQLSAKRQEGRRSLDERVREAADENRREGEAFLAANAAKEGVVTLDSGLQYKVLTAGDGPRPDPDDAVVCHYRGTLLDGTEFDSSHRRQKPGTFALGRVIEGWKEALQLMPVGSRWEIVIPPDLAYGARGTGTIPPNATLVFEVELLSIQGRPGAVARNENAGP